MKHILGDGVLESNFLQEWSFTEQAGHASSKKEFLWLLHGWKWEVELGRGVDQIAK